MRNWTADDRAAHRVFERSRREAFKSRLTSLASLIPSLHSTDPNRLSKHVVIDESITLHREEQQKLAHLLRQVESLVDERDELLTEVNQWRARAGLGIIEPRPLEPKSDPITRPEAGQVNSNPSPERPVAEIEGQARSNVQQHSVQQAEPSMPLAPIPPHMAGLDNGANIAHTGVTPPNWDLMGMDMNSAGMVDSNLGYNDLFSTNMLNYPPGSKPPLDLGHGAFAPGDIDQQQQQQQQQLNVINPMYGGDPRVYGQ